MISFKEFVGKKPPADIIVKVRFKLLNSLIPDINITKISRRSLNTKIRYKEKVFYICFKLKLFKYKTNYLFKIILLFEKKVLKD